MSSKENIIQFEGMEFKCFSLIEYSSLIQLLKLLAKKSKNLEEKLSILDGRMIEKDKRISELEIMLKGTSQSKDNEFPSIEVNSKFETSKKNQISNEKEKFILNENDNGNLESNNLTSDKNKDKIIDNEDDKDKKDKDEQDYDNRRNNSENGDLSQQKYDDSQHNLNKSESIINKSLTNEEKDKSNNDVDDIYNNNIIGSSGKKDEDNLSENGSKILTSGKATTTNINKRDMNSEANNIDENKKRNTNNEADIVEYRETIAKILKKLKIHDKQLNELSIKSSEHSIINKNIKKNQNDIEDINKRLNSLKNSINEINQKFLDFNDDFEKIKVKVQDFNVYDLIQGIGGNGNIDAAKLLVMNLENKIFKKFGIYDERNKKNDKDLFKMQEDLKNALAIVDGMKMNTKRNTDSLNELSEKFNNSLSNHENLINEIQRKIEQLTIKINSGPDFTGLKKDLEKKLKDLEEKINSKIDLFLNRETGEENTNGLTLKSEDMAMLKDLRRRIGELESFVSETFTRINADDMKKRINTLETEMAQKASKYEVIEITEKLKNLDEYVKDLNFKVDSLQQFTEKVRLDLVQIIKKIEFLSGEYSKLSFNKSGKNADEGRTAIDITKFIDLNVFNENKKDINSKFEKVRLGFEDLSREIEEILSKLSHTPTDKDFSQFQSIIKNLLDDLKINCNKKFADKFETAKSIKFLEAQIKTIHETYNKRNEAGDNWLLAKKPINNYVCASCEANIRGELDKRTEFVPWNRYPIRDDKAYRLGHGFSRMLQMVNEDIIKSAGEKGYSSDEDKKLNIKNNNGEKTYSVNVSVKLPKVNKRKPAVSSAFQAATEPNSSSSPYNDADNGDNNVNKPQIMRVIRKNKGGQTQSPSKNSEGLTQRSNEYSINEKNMPNNEDLPPINNNDNEN